MKLIVDDIRIRCAPSGSPIADGCIYLIVGDICFPAPDWFDLISADLEEWIPKLLSFAKGHTDTCSISFFDGPYRVLLVRNRAGETRVTCADGNRIVIQNVPVNTQELFLSCAKALRCLATSLYRQENRAQYESLISDLGRVSKEFQTIANH